MLFTRRLVRFARSGGECPGLELSHVVGRWTRAALAGFNAVYRRNGAAALLHALDDRPARLLLMVALAPLLVADKNGARS